MEQMEEKNGTSNTQQTVIVQTAPSHSNGLGTSGFVLALLGLILCWVPGLGWLLWLLGLILSFCGLFKKPRGLAIAGMVISLIDLIVLTLVIGAIATVLSSL